MEFLLTAWTPITLFIIGGLVSVGIGISKSSECGKGTPCMTGRNLLIASDVFYIIATLIFAYGMDHFGSDSTTAKIALIMSTLFFVIASILLGVGADRTDVCLDTCKTGMNWLIASNILFLLAGLIFAGHVSGGKSKTGSVFTDAGSIEMK